MKKRYLWFLAWFLTLGLFCILNLKACSRYKDALNREACYNEVQNKYPNSTIVSVENYAFVIKTPEGKVFFIANQSSFSPRITKEIYCFDIGKK